jgi:hypothetical protein
MTHTRIPPFASPQMMSWRSCLSRLFSPNNSSTKRTRLYCSSSTHTRQREKRNETKQNNHVWTLGINGEPDTQYLVLKLFDFFNNGRSIILPVKWTWCPVPLPLGMLLENVTSTSVTSFSAVQAKMSYASSRKEERISTEILFFVFVSNFLNQLQLFLSFLTYL